MEVNFFFNLVLALFLKAMWTWQDITSLNWTLVNLCVLARVFRETELIRDKEWERGDLLQELAHVVMEAKSPTVCRLQAGKTGGEIQSKSEGLRLWGVGGREERWWWRSWSELESLRSGTPMCKDKRKSILLFLFNGLDHTLQNW